MSIPMTLSFRFCRRTSSPVCFHHLIDPASSELDVKECHSVTSLLNRIQIGSSTNNNGIVNQIAPPCTWTVEMPSYRVYHRSGDSMLAY